MTIYMQMKKTWRCTSYSRFGISPIYLNTFTVSMYIIQNKNVFNLNIYFLTGHLITVERLNFLKEHHINKLFQDLPVGEQAEFEQRLKIWCSESQLETTYFSSN